MVVEKIVQAFVACTRRSAAATCSNNPPTITRTTMGQLTWTRTPQSILLPSRGSSPRLGVLWSGRTDAPQLIERSMSSRVVHRLPLKQTRLFLKTIILRQPPPLSSLRRKMKINLRRRRRRRQKLTVRAIHQMSKFQDLFNLNSTLFVFSSDLFWSLFVP